MDEDWLVRMMASSLCVFQEVKKGGEEGETLEKQEGVKGEVARSYLWFNEERGKKEEKNGSRRRGQGEKTWAHIGSFVGEPRGRASFSLSFFAKNQRK